VRVALATLLPLLAACRADRPPTAPAAPPRLPAGIALAAFQLTINTRTGQITTAAPRASASSRGASPVGAVRPSLSLVGSDVVALHASNCTFTAVPNNTRQKRCTFTLAIENRLANTDLVTAKTFPSLPAGTNGIVVFPFTAAALGLPGGSAAPSPDWDNAPANILQRLRRLQQQDERLLPIRDVPVAAQRRRDEPGAPRRLLRRQGRAERLGLRRRRRRLERSSDTHDRRRARQLRDRNPP
jgi:hypothetical protein